MDSQTDPKVMSVSLISTYKYTWNWRKCISIFDTTLDMEMGKKTIHVKTFKASLTKYYRVCSKGCVQNLRRGEAHKENVTMSPSERFTNATKPFAFDPTPRRQYSSAHKNVYGQARMLRVQSGKKHRRPCYSTCQQSPPFGCPELE